MGDYEKISIITSALALLFSIGIPLLSYLKRKYFTKSKMHLVPFDKLILLFNESGSYFKFKFSLVCENKSAVIKSINAEVVRKSNNQTINLEWSTLEALSVTKYNSNYSNTITTAHPNRVQADSITPLQIEFSNSNVKARSKLDSVCVFRNNAIQTFLTNIKKINENLTPEEFCEQFKKLPIYFNILNDFLEYYFWKDDNYLLKIIILYDFDKKHEENFEFSISTEEALLLRENIEKTVFCGFMIDNKLSPGFNAIYKSIIENR